MDIEGLGEKNVELLYSQGLISHFEDIYKLTKDKLLTLPRFAEKSATNLIDAIEQSKTTTLAKFLYALGILHVGEYVAKLLARNFKSLEDLYDISASQIMEIKQVGEKIALSVSAFFSDRANIDALNRLRSLGLTLSNPDYAEIQKVNGPFEGMTFVITGTLPVPRKEVENMIEKYGGRVSSAVSGNTAYVVVGDDAGSKLAKARSLGIQTISYEELQKITSSN
jgi:DNA ligase (NAD+)